VPFGLVLAPVVLLAVCRNNRSKSLRWGCSYLTAFLLLYSLWPARNHRVFKAWILGSTAGAGGTFYTYLQVPQELGGTAQQTEILARDPMGQRAVPSDPVAREKFLFKAGIENIRQDPWRYVKLVAWRFFWDWWRLWPRQRAYDHSYATLKWVSLLSDGWIIPLGFAGMALVRLQPGPVLWIYSLVFSVSFVYSLILTMLRYRLPIMPWMILFASCALRQAWERRTR